ncbi:MAG: Rpn family recombination-promoting nuclease/putative transposase [Porticoccaceae bacterium]
MDHDTGYKLLFSHPEMIRDLLLGYVPGEWIQDADFATLEHINGSYVSESERQRHDDRVWRVRVRILLRRKAPRSSISEIERINDIMEADSMLAERIEGWFDEAEQRGLQKGLEKGRQEGLQTGEAMALRRLLGKRFGPLPAGVEARIERASLAQVEGSTRPSTRPRWMVFLEVARGRSIGCADAGGAPRRAAVRFVPQHTLWDRANGNTGTFP